MNPEDQSSSPRQTPFRLPRLPDVPGHNRNELDTPISSRNRGVRPYPAGFTASSPNLGSSSTRSPARSDKEKTDTILTAIREAGWSVSEFNKQFNIPEPTREGKAKGRTSFWGPNGASSTPGSCCGLCSFYDGEGHRPAGAHVSQNAPRFQSQAKGNLCGWMWVAWRTRIGNGSAAVS